MRRLDPGWPPRRRGCVRGPRDPGLGQHHTLVGDLPRERHQAMLIVYSPFSAWCTSSIRTRTSTDRPVDGEKTITPPPRSMPVPVSASPPSCRSPTSTSGFSDRQDAQRPRLGRRRRLVAHRPPILVALPLVDRQRPRTRLPAGRNRGAHDHADHEPRPTAAFIVSLSPCIEGDGDLAPERGGTATMLRSRL